MKKLLDTLFYLLTLICAVGTMIALAGIIFSIFYEGLPLFKTVSWRSFLFGTAWYPTHAKAEFGIATLIAGSFSVTLGALIIAIPLGLGSAIYISEIAPPRFREVCKPMIELLAGIPSVVYGLFGMAFLAPLIRQVFHLESGLNLFTASIILGLMVLPIISSMCEDALSCIPKAIREASFALGANKWETITRVLIPAAKTGVIGAVLMGFGRALGETMVVLMVAGGSAQIPSSIFSSVRPITAAISAEMGETVFRDLHYQSLFALAIVLFIVTFAFSLLSELIGKKK